MYLCTNHIDLYEQVDFQYNTGIGYHQWGESSRIYEKQVGGSRINKESKNDHHSLISMV